VSNAPPRRKPPLDVLSGSVREARAVVRQRRHGRIEQKELAEARHALIAALEEYTVALEQRRLPVPHALRAELEMHRQLFDW
jgi:signal transduction histidine kinase